MHKNRLNREYITHCKTITYPQQSQHSKS